MILQFVAEISTLLSPIIFIQKLLILHSITGSFSLEPVQNQKKLCTVQRNSKGHQLQVNNLQQRDHFGKWSY